MAATNQGPPTVQAGDGVDVSAPRARGAYPGRRILWILMASLAMVVIAFLVAFATNPTTPVDDKSGNSRTTQPAVAERFDTPAPAPKPPG